MGLGGERRRVGQHGLCLTVPFPSRPAPPLPARPGHEQVCKGVDHVFNLAADMGGMGFIQSNHSVIMYNNTVRLFWHCCIVCRAWRQPAQAAQLSFPEDGRAGAACSRPGQRLAHC